MTYLLTSSCRASSVSFASVSEAEAFLASRKLSEETVCLCDKAGNVIFTRTYNCKVNAMSYASYFFTGVVKSGDKYIGRYDGEFVGSFDTWGEANAAVKARSRR
jgi:hypothetical protein